MPKLKHYDDLGTTRFVTFCCYRLGKYLSNSRARELLVKYLDEARRKHVFQLLGYVIMPEHVHLVLLPPDGMKLGLVIREIKSKMAREYFASVMRDTPGKRVYWEKRCYDHNCRSADAVREKINSIKPVMKAGRDPEAIFHEAILEEVESIARGLNSDALDSKYILLSEFGLDVAIIFCLKDHVSLRLLELRAYSGKRAGGVGFGNGRGRGCQVDLLLHDSSLLALTNPIIRWVIWDTTQSTEKCFAVLTSAEAKSAAVGSGVERDKQNNFSIKKVFALSCISWDELSLRLKEFMQA